MTSSPETIEKMEKAQKLFSQNKSVAEIGKELGLSESRVKELLKGVNWNSAKGSTIKIE